MKLRGPRVLVRPSLARDAEFVQQLIDELPHYDNGCTWERHVIERTDDSTAVGLVALAFGAALASRAVVIA